MNEKNQAQLRSLTGESRPVEESKKFQTLTSLEVAEMVEKDHNKLLRDVRTYIEQLGASNIGHTDFFVESTYTSEQNKELPCFEVTKKGCEFIANKLTGIKGTEFTAKYINRFHDMEEHIERTRPLTHQEMMRIQLGMIDDVSERVDKLENTMVIDYGQQRVLERLVNTVVITALGGKGSTAYKEISKKVFSECNRDIKDYFDVNSRNNIPRIKFDDACKYIRAWQPCTNTKIMINECNAQMCMA